MNLMNNAEERKHNEDILKKFDSEAPQRKDGTISGEELAVKVAAKNDATGRLAEMAKEEQSRNVKPKDVHTELLVSEDGELNF
jgi:hypothetical protein